MFEFFLLNIKVSKSAAFHTPCGWKILILYSKSASQHHFAHHMCLIFCFVSAQSANQQPFTHHMVLKICQLKPSQQVSSFSHIIFLENVGSSFEVSKSVPIHTPHVFEFFLLSIKVSKSSAFHTPHTFYFFFLFDQSQLKLQFKKYG